MSRVLLVAIGGSIGCLGRYLITGWVQNVFGAGFPWGTAIVNTVGCFFIGLTMTIGVELSLISMEARIFIVTGILGGLTTFSSFGYESLRTILEGSIWLGLANIGLNLIVGLAAVGTGIWIARLFWS